MGYLSTFWGQLGSSFYFPFKFCVRGVAVCDHMLRGRAPDPRSLGWGRGVEGGVEGGGGGGGGRLSIGLSCRFPNVRN